MTLEEHEAYLRRVRAKLKEIKDYTWGTPCQCGHDLEYHYMTRLIPCSQCECGEFKKAT